MSIIVDKGRYGVELIGWLSENPSELSADVIDLIKLDEVLNLSEKLGFSRKLDYSTSGDSQKFGIIWDFKDLMSSKAIELREKIVESISFGKFGIYITRSDSKFKTFDVSSTLGNIIRLIPNNTESIYRLSTASDHKLTVRLIYNNFTKVPAEFLLELYEKSTSSTALILNSQTTANSINNFLSNLNSKSLVGGVSYITKRSLIEYLEDLVIFEFFEDNPELSEIIKTIEDTRREYFKNSENDINNIYPF